MNEDNYFSEPFKTKGKILIVEDEEGSRHLLKEILQIDGHNVFEAETGEEALKVARKINPDAVLLDIILPGINGFEVCKKLKEDPVTDYIPVVMISVLKERSDRIRGIKEGAMDFISKPIDRLEVLLKVKNAIFLKHLMDNVKKSYEKLKELEGLKNDLTSMIVHDLRQPLMVISGYLQLFELENHEGFTEKQITIIKKIINAVDLLKEMTGSLLDISRLETGEMKLNKTICNIGEIVNEVMENLGPKVESYSFSFEFPDQGVLVQCDRDIIRRVFTNIIENAFKFTPEGGKIRIAAEIKNDEVLFSITDSGPGIPPQYHSKIFEKFGVLEVEKERKRYSVGLGLAFCKLAVEAHKGSIGVNSEPDRGSTFWFALPTG